MSPPFMRRRFIVGIIASLCSFTLAFEAISVEAPRPGAEGTLRFGDGSSVHVAGKFAALITEGLSAARSKHYNRAISLFTTALEANRDKNVAFFIHFQRGLAYGLTGNSDKAIDDYTAAIQLNPKDAPAYYNRAIQYSNKRNYELAIRDSTAAIQLNPKNRSAYINRAIQYSNKRQYNLAFRDATTAIELDPKYANAYHIRGACHAETGAFENAVADYSQAIRLDPTRAITIYSRGGCYEELEQFDKAIADYDRVIRITPKDSDNYDARGGAYFAKGNYKQALSDFEKAVQLSQNNAGAWGHLAWLKAACPEDSLRNGKEAIWMSIKACELSNWKEPGPIFALAAAYAETGDFDQAVKYQMQGIKMNSTYGPVSKETRERLTLYRDHKPYRSKPLVAR